MSEIRISPEFNERNSFNRAGEILNPNDQNSNDQNFYHISLCTPFVLNIWILRLFRIWCLEFGISSVGSLNTSIE